METRNPAENGQPSGLPTLALAKLCHHCGICPFAARRTGSGFERVMRWHRTWCPAWKAHEIVYGAKPLS